IREQQPAGERVERAVAQDQLDLRARRALQMAGLDRLLQAQQIGVALGEIGVDRVELLDCRQMGRFALADQRALGHQGAADAPGDRCGDVGVPEIEFRPGQGGGGRDTWMPTLMVDTVVTHAAPATTSTAQKTATSTARAMIRHVIAKTTLETITTPEPEKRCRSES